MHPVPMACEPAIQQSKRMRTMQYARHCCLLAIGMMTGYQRFSHLEKCPCTTHPRRHQVAGTLKLVHTLSVSFLPAVGHIPWRAGHAYPAHSLTWHTLCGAAKAVDAVKRRTRKGQQRQLHRASNQGLKTLGCCRQDPRVLRGALTAARSVTARSQRAPTGHSWTPVMVVHGACLVSCQTPCPASP